MLDLLVETCQDGEKKGLRHLLSGMARVTGGSLSRTGCLETGKLKEHSKVTSTSITNPVFAVQGQLERGVYNLQHVLNWVQTCYSASRPLW